MNRMNRRIADLQHDARELERLARVLHDEGLPGAAEHVEDALFGLNLYVEDLKTRRENQTPEQVAQALLG